MQTEQDSNEISSRAMTIHITLRIFHVHDNIT